MRVAIELLYGYGWTLPLIYWAFGVLFYFAALPDELDSFTKDDSPFSGCSRASLGSIHLEIYEHLARKNHRIENKEATLFLTAFAWPFDWLRLHRIKTYLKSPTLFGNPSP